MVPDEELPEVISNPEYKPHILLTTIKVRSSTGSLRLYTSSLKTRYIMFYKVNRYVVYKGYTTNPHFKNSTFYRGHKINGVRAKELIEIMKSLLMSS